MMFAILARAFTNLIFYVKVNLIIIISLDLFLISVCSCFTVLIWLLVLLDPPLLRLHDMISTHPHLHLAAAFDSWSLEASKFWGALWPAVRSRPLLHRAYVQGPYAVSLGWHHILVLKDWLGETSPPSL
jgi:hypothetical protein